LPVFRAPAPDGRMRKQALVDPGVAVLQFFWRHVFGLKNGMTRVVERPVAMQDSPLRLHLSKERRCRIRSKNVKCGTLQPVLFNPLRSAREYVFAVVIEAEDERAVHLNAIVMQDSHAA